MCQRITFQIGNRHISVTEPDVNRILQFPQYNLVPGPTKQEHFAFFQRISYESEFEEFILEELGDMYKHRLPKEWNFFFHTVNPCFAPKKGGFIGIPEFSQKLGYAIANNLNINFGKLVLIQILHVMGPIGFRNIQTQSVDCFYPRFLQLILNDVLTSEEKALYANSETSSSAKLKNNMITGLEGRGDYVNNNPAVFTDFIQGCVADMELPVPHGPQMDAPIQHDEGVHDHEEAMEAESEGEATGMPTESYHPGSPTSSTACKVLDADFNFFGLNDLYDTE